MNGSEFIEKANIVHNGRYDYSLVKYINCNTKIAIICKTHGVFYQLPKYHTQGNGCKRCFIDSRVLKTSLTQDEFINRSRLIHNNYYDYNNIKYVNYVTYVLITCPKHGEFKQTPSGHLRGKGCRPCEISFKAADRIKTTENFIVNSNIIHHNRYDYEQSDYDGCFNKLKIICKIHGVFEQKPNIHLNGHGCPKCSGTHLQCSVYDFIKQSIECEYNNRGIINPLEIDVYIPPLRLGIEINGLYYHSYAKLETVNERNRHLFKLKKCQDNGIQLLQFTEYEWNNKQNICKSIIINKLKKSNRIFARKCKLYVPSNDEYREFLNNNHIQGYKTASYKIALKFNDTIMCIMSFNKHSKYEWEITRLSSKLNFNIVGGASRLLSKFINDVKPKQIMTYSDKRFGNGEVYSKLGFKLIGETKPNYCYIKNSLVYSRQQFQKHKLKKKLQIFNDKLSEAQNMFNNKYRRMWDAGHNKFLLEIKHDTL